MAQTYLYLLTKDRVYVVPADKPKDPHITLPVDTEQHQILRFHAPIPEETVILIERGKPFGDIAMHRRKLAVGQLSDKIWESIKGDPKTNTVENYRRMLRASMQQGGLPESMLSEAEYGETFGTTDRYKAVIDYKVKPHYPLEKRITSLKTKEPLAPIHLCFKVVAATDKKLKGTYLESNALSALRNEGRPITITTDTAFPEIPAVGASVAWNVVPVKPDRFYYGEKPPCFTAFSS